MKRAAPATVQSISLTNDQLFYLGAMALYASRPHSHYHDEKLTAMDNAVNDAALLWAVVRNRTQRPAQGDDVPDAPSPPWTP